MKNKVLPNYVASIKFIIQIKVFVISKTFCVIGVLIQYNNMKWLNETKKKQIFVCCW